MDKKVVLYPCYFDSTKTRKYGRRVPLSLAVKKPKVEEIALVAKKLGLNPVIEKDKKHPRTWFFDDGRVLVDKVRSKTYVVKLIAKNLKALRGTKE